MTGTRKALLPDLLQLTGCDYNVTMMWAANRKTWHEQESRVHKAEVGA